MEDLERRIKSLPPAARKLVREHIAASIAATREGRPLPREVYREQERQRALAQKGEQTPLPSPLPPSEEE